MLVEFSPLGVHSLRGFFMPYLFARGCALFAGPWQAHGRTPRAVFFNSPTFAPSFPEHFKKEFPPLSLHRVKLPGEKFFFFFFLSQLLPQDVRKV